MKKLPKPLGWALIGLVLSACNNDGATVGPPPVPAAEQQLLAFVTAAGELKTFDPSNPSAPALTVATGLQDTLRILDGDYRASDHTLADPHHPVLIYLKEGKVFRLNLLKSALQTPFQVTSITDACRILDAYFDYANPNNTRIVVETQGSDPNCAVRANNGARYFPIGADDLADGTSISPTEFGIRESIYGSNGSLQAFLVAVGPLSNRSLQRYPVNLLNPQPIAAIEPNTLLDMGGPQPTGNLFYFRLRVAATPFTCLYRFNSANNQLSNCLHDYTDTTMPLFFTSEADANYVYYADTNQAFRLPHDGTAPAPIRIAGANFSISNLRLSAGRVILNGVDNGTGQFSLESVPRAGGTPIPLRLGGLNSITLSEVAGQHVYYVVDNPSTPGNDAYATLEDGTGQLLFPKAGWGGFSASTDRVSLGLSNRFMDVFHGVLGQAGQDPSSVDVNIFSFDAQTGENQQALGTIPYAVSSVSYAFGRYRLSEVSVFRPGGPPGNADTDVYFADTQTPNSLRPLATTVGANDVIAF